VLGDVRTKDMNTRGLAHPAGSPPSLPASPPSPSLTEPREAERPVDRVGGAGRATDAGWGGVDSENGLAGPRQRIEICIYNDEARSTLAPPTRTTRGALAEASRPIDRVDGAWRSAEAISGGIGSESDLAGPRQRIKKVCQCPVSDCQNEPFDDDDPYCDDCGACGANQGNHGCKCRSPNCDGRFCDGVYNDKAVSTPVPATRTTHGALAKGMGPPNSQGMTSREPKASATSMRPRGWDAAEVCEPTTRDSARVRAPEAQCESCGQWTDLTCGGMTRARIANIAAESAQQTLSDLTRSSTCKMTHYCDAVCQEYDQIAHHHRSGGACGSLRTPFADAEA
jgi:hypothetical protein